MLMHLSDDNIATGIANAINTISMCTTITQAPRRPVTKRLLCNSNENLSRNP